MAINEAPADGEGAPAATDAGVVTTVYKVATLDAYLGRPCVEHTRGDITASEIYDLNGRVTHILINDVLVKHFVYNGAGQLTKDSSHDTLLPVTDILSKHKIDVSDALLADFERCLPHPPSNTIARSTYFTYDALGNITGVTLDGEDPEVIFHDYLQLTSVVKSASSPERLKCTYYPSGALKYLSQGETDADRLLEVALDPRGRTLRWSYKGHVQKTYSYDAVDRVCFVNNAFTGLAFNGPHGQSAFNSTLGYPADTHRPVTSVAISDTSSQLYDKFSRTFDGLGRVTQRLMSDSRDTPLRQEDITYTNGYSRNERSVALASNPAYSYQPDTDTPGLDVETFFSDDASVPDLHCGYSHDAQGRICKYTGALIQQSFKYDERGRMSSVVSVFTVRNNDKPDTPSSITMTSSQIYTASDRIEVEQLEIADDQHVGAGSTPAPVLSESMIPVYDGYGRLLGKFYTAAGMYITCTYDMYSQISMICMWRPMAKLPMVTITFRYDEFHNEVGRTVQLGDQALLAMDAIYSESLQLQQQTFTVAGSPVSSMHYQHRYDGDASLRETEITFRGKYNSLSASAKDDFFTERYTFEPANFYNLASSTYSFTYQGFSAPLPSRQEAYTTEHGDRLAKVSVVANFDQVPEPAATQTLEYNDLWALRSYTSAQSAGPSSRNFVYDKCARLIASTQNGVTHGYEYDSFSNPAVIKEELSDHSSGLTVSHYTGNRLIATVAPTSDTRNPRVSIYFGELLLGSLVYSLNQQSLWTAETLEILCTDSQGTNWATTTLSLAAATAQDITTTYFSYTPYGEQHIWYSQTRNIKV